MITDGKDLVGVVSSTLRSHGGFREPYPKLSSGGLTPDDRGHGSTRTTVHDSGGKGEESTLVVVVVGPTRRVHRSDTGRPALRVGPEVVTKEARVAVVGR